MPSDDNASVVRRFYEELWNDWDLAVADEILAPDLNFRGTLGAASSGVEAFREYFEFARRAFPDLHAELATTAQPAGWVGIHELRSRFPLSEKQALGIRGEKRAPDHVIDCWSSPLAEDPPAG